jgi:hypothetical protein
MFCEGYYLHRLLANTFEEERSLAFILTIGWGKKYGVDFDNILRAAFMCADPKSAKHTVKWSVFFAFL